MIRDFIQNFQLINKNRILSILSVLLISAYNAPFLFLEDLSVLNIKKLFVIYQHIIPIVIFLTLLIFFDIKSIFKKIFLNRDYLLVTLFFLTFILQLYGVFFSELKLFFPINEVTSQPDNAVLINSEVKYVRFVYVINSINLFFLLSLLHLRNILELFIFILISILLVVFAFYSVRILGEYFTTDSSIYFYESRVLALGTDLFSFIPQPRSTGLSRTALIISIFLTLYFLIKEKTNSFVLLSVITFLNFFIFHFQTRFGIYCFIILNIFFILLSWKGILRSLRSKIFILFLIFFPMLLSYSVAKIKINIVLNEYCKQSKIDCADYKVTQSKLESFGTSTSRATNVKLHGLSNRDKIWKIILNDYDRLPLMGYGVLGDRFAYSTSASNVFIYSLISGGILNVVLMFYFFTHLALKIIFLLRARNLNNNYNLLFLFSLLMILAFSLRSLVENSIAQFSIDLMIFLPALFYVHKYFLAQKKLNK